MEGYVEHQVNEKELAQKVEDEHLRLQRQVRMIQSDREENSMGVNPQFRRQDNLMRILKKDYLNCIKDLKIARSGAHKKNDLKMKADLERALLYRVQTEQQTEEGIFEMGQVEQLLWRKKKQMIELRNSVAFNIGQLAERRRHSEFRLYSTENKLEAAMNRFNVIQGENRRIRDEIEHMLKDRALFNQAWSKMMTALGKGKKFLEDLFESSTLAYDQREEWVTKLRSVQEKGKMDQALQVQEMRDLQRAFDHEMKLHNFLARKGVTRINQQVEEIEEAQKMKEEEETRKEIEAHKKILDEIFDYTKEEDVNKIKELFDHVEQNNFSVYQLLTDFCAENEMLTRDMRRISRDIEDRRDWNEMMEEKRVSKIKQLQEDLDRQKQRTEQRRVQVEGAKEKLRTTMEKVEEIFNMLNCSLEPYQNLLGDKGPSLNCLRLTFQLINERIQEHMELVYYSERVHKRGSTKSSRLKKYIIFSDRPNRMSAVTIDDMVPANPCPACMEARWFLRLGEKAEQPFDKEMAVEALIQLSRDTAYMRSDRIHPLTDCRAPLSRAILAKRYI